MKSHHQLFSFFLFIADFFSVFPADMCIEKSLLLFRFTPCGVPCQDNDSTKAAEGSSAPLLRSSSISEGDFQPSSSPVPQSSGTEEGAEAKAGQNQPSGAQAQSSSSCVHSRPGHRGSTESLSSQSGEPASPSAFPRKAPFSRARLRLLSCRSIEEPRMTPSVKDRYPILKHILNFIRDQALTTARWLTHSLLFCIFNLFILSYSVKLSNYSPSFSILQTLSLSKAQAVSVCKVLEMVQQCLHSLGKPHLFQAPCILFLQELLACQKDFTRYILSKCFQFKSNSSELYLSYNTDSQKVGTMHLFCQALFLCLWCIKIWKDTVNSLSMCPTIFSLIMLRCEKKNLDCKKGNSLST